MPAVISHVSDTARWVATYRATESERPDALFRDPYARRLAGPRGEEIVRALPKGRSMGWPMVVRTAVMDEIILRVVGRNGVDTVLNLAAGLDARPWRLALPASLRWVDVDHADMIEYKAAHLADAVPRCRYQGQGVDLADGPDRRALLTRVKSAAGRVLVVTEGLLVYLAPEAVAELARDLHRQAGFEWWLTDLASPRLLEMLEKSWGPVVAAGNAPFRFGPAESSGFFLPFGWREAEYRSTFYEGLRLKRTFPMAPVFAFLGRLAGRRRRTALERFSGIALLQREPMQ
jgi:methyltransferase (TIGR00027 family)